MSRGLGDVYKRQGVDEDDEALDLVKFQNAYNLASKMISTMAEMYDQLILNTAV